jgi:hypothetical protein
MPAIAMFFICASIVVPAALLVTAIVNDYRSHPRSKPREGF